MPSLKQRLLQTYVTMDFFKPADCYYHEENIIANTLVYE